jgi:hypothetical protein
VQALKLRARLISFACDADGQITANQFDDGVLVCDNGRISQLMSAADYAAKGFALSECPA